MRIFDEAKEGHFYDLAQAEILSTNLLLFLHSSRPFLTTFFSDSV